MISVWVGIPSDLRSGTHSYATPASSQRCTSWKLSKQDANSLSSQKDHHSSVGTMGLLAAKALNCCAIACSAGRRLTASVPALPTKTTKTARKERGST